MKFSYHGVFYLILLARVTCAMTVFVHVFGKRTYRGIFQGQLTEALISDCASEQVWASKQPMNATKSPRPIGDHGGAHVKVSQMCGYFGAPEEQHRNYSSLDLANCVNFRLSAK